MMLRTRSSIALLLAASLLIASCSTDGSSESSTTRETRETRETRASSTTSSVATVDQTDTTTTVPTTTTSTPKPSGPAPDPTSVAGPIGVIGCSNTDLAVTGYTDVSSVDKMTTGDLGGGSESNWGNPSDDRYGVYWGIYDSRRPADGYPAVWVQVCLRTSEHNGAFDADEQAWTTHIVEQIHSRDPGIPIWISGINSYADGTVCSAVGVDGPAIAAETSDWAAANLADVFRGPDIGPLQPEHIGVRDDCHPNSSGQQFLGQQLVAFFD